MKVRCPSCGKKAEWEDNAERPFCSELCRKRDLGNWATEQYRITTEEGLSSEAAPEEDERGDGGS